MTDETTPKAPSNFIRHMVEEDLQSGKWDGKVVTRFPPEPNGFLHIGHAKSICLNFGLARDYNGRCHLRFDDTNPSKEEDAYVEAIKEDVRWLGFDWGEHLYYASDYFEKMYELATLLIEKGLAYVCDLSAEETRELRGTLKTPGTDSPYRDRSVEENLELFQRMRAGEFADGARTLRAKIDMASPNMNMRDPVMYRILNAEHHRTADAWCIYPMYDWAHGLEDSFEGITYSLCTLEFQDHRPLYDWFLDQLPVFKTQQTEFARLNLNYTVMSKRKLLELVNGGHVNGWDDPRMPTLAGMRRRGYPPEAIRDFCERAGVAKANSTTDFAMLEACVREYLNKNAPRFMAVINPLKVTITNWPEGEVEMLDAVNNPEDESAGSRQVPFSGELYIEREDFMEDPPRKFFRLGPGREVRLRWAYFITCNQVIKDDAGEVVELRCTYDPETKGGDAPDGRKVKGTLHWVAAESALKAEVRLYNHLFTVENPNKAPEGGEWTDNINKESLEVRSECYLEPALANVKPGETIQFERLGYFCKDADSSDANPIFNRTSTLRDTWAKVKKKS
jgi:glutaminyl-tRNA synthetase